MGKFDDDRALERLEDDLLNNHLDEEPDIYKQIEKKWAYEEDRIDWSEVK